MKKRLAVIFILAALALASQVALRCVRTDATPQAGLFASIGAVRSIAAEVIWFRADRLQEEGRYVELAQLARALTAMEPHTPEVWSYAAWNLAYNVSVMMATYEGRWRWVLSALELLRDEGLHLNPRSAELHQELAWLFELKLGTNIDSAAQTYRANWARIVTDVKARGAWEELGMDAAEMARVEQETGFDDWTDPHLSAVYWAHRGLPFARGKTRSILAETLRQSCVLYSKNHPSD